MQPHEIVVLVASSTGLSCGVPLYVHVPQAPEAGRVPDSAALWAVIWAMRAQLLGIAHTHPPGHLIPSAQDIATAYAIERALGRTLRWWIVDPDTLQTVEFRPAGAGYSLSPVVTPPVWAMLAGAHAFLTPPGARS